MVCRPWLGLGAADDTNRVSCTQRCLPTPYKGATNWHDPGRVLNDPGSSSDYGITNRGQVVLRYFSAAAPAFVAEELAALWPMASERDERTEVRSRKEVI